MVSGWEYAIGPVVGALIGCATNWLAIKMLFRPRREVRVLGLRFCGLIPKRRPELTNRVGDIVATELLTHEDLRRVVESANLAPPILETVEERLDQFLNDQMRSLPRLARRMISRDAIDRIKLSFLLELEQILPRLSEEVIEAIESKVDFKQMIVDKLDSVEIEKFEELTYRLARREMRSIVVVGALLGFLIGATQSLWLWLAW
jgi:uncharacterized membrane protein YheB (UPF0754 family)